MEAHVALGDTAQAMRCYERLWQVLDEELDVEPSEKTQSLYVAIKQGRLQPRRRRPSRSRPSPICWRRSRSWSSRQPGPAALPELRLLRRHLPARDDVGAVALPRLAGDRRAPDGTAPPPTASIILRITVRGETTASSSHDARRPSGRALHVVRARHGEPGWHGDVATDVGSEPGGRAERASLEPAPADRPRSSRARWDASTSSGCKRRRSSQRLAGRVRGAGPRRSCAS